MQASRAQARFEPETKGSSDSSSGSAPGDLGGSAPGGAVSAPVQTTEAPGTLSPIKNGV